MKEKIQLHKPRGRDLALKNLSSSQAIQCLAEFKGRICQWSDDSLTFLPKEGINTSIYPLAQLYFRLKCQHSNPDKDSIGWRFEFLLLHNWKTGLGKGCLSDLSNDQLVNTIQQFNTVQDDKKNIGNLVLKLANAGGRYHRLAQDLDRKSYLIFLPNNITSYQ